jgi:hypothetical protein
VSAPAPARKRSPAANKSIASKPAQPTASTKPPAKVTASTNAGAAKTPAAKRGIATTLIETRAFTTKSAALLAACALARPLPDGCAWCGVEKPVRRRVWCSERCATAFWTNHWWTLARSATKRRDRYRCRTCGAAAPKRPSRAAFPSETAYRTAMRAWRAAKKTQRMEVNHRVPCRGKHGTLSCDHHLDNLETLCTACHRTITTIDRKQTAQDAASRRRTA